MNDYSVSRYSIFQDAVSSVQDLNQGILTGVTVLEECKSMLGDGSIFMGPICDSCVEGFVEVDSKMSTMSSNFTTISEYITETASTYRAGDDKASLKILSSGFDGMVTASSLQHVTTQNGTTIYYNQNGYYDKDGNWCKWQSNWGKDIATSGCGPTSMASVLATMFQDSSITPTTVANMLNRDDNIGGNYVKKVADAYHLDQTHKIALNQDKLNTFLRNDGKVIVAVNNGGHYISVLGINDSTNPPTYIVCDPNDKNTATKTWNYNDISNGHTMVFHIAPQGKTVEECFNDSSSTLVQL